MNRAQAEKQKQLLADVSYPYGQSSDTGNGIEWDAPQVATPPGVHGLGFARFRVNGETVGFHFVHLPPDMSYQCGGYLWTSPEYGTPTFTVEQEEPLTLAPSLHCTRCGIHGFVREGRWIEA